MVTDRLDDRGQLLLVGAIAIALVLLGLVLVINTATFTQVVGSEGTSETTTESSVSAEELGGAVAAVVADANADGQTPGSLSIDDEMDSIRTQFANRTVGGSGAFVDVEYAGFTEQGARVSEEDVSFDSATGWSPSDESTRTDVGRFLMTVDTSTFGAFEVEIDGPSNESTLRVGSDGSEAIIVADTPEGTTTCDEIDPAGSDEIRIDVSNGRVYDEPSCRFNIFEPLETGYWIEFSQYGASGDLDGSYEFVTNESSDIGGPDRTPAIWSFEYSYTYEIDEMTSHSEEREVTVYD